MAIRKLSAQSTSTPKEKMPVSKVQASEKSKPRSPLVRSDNEEVLAHKLASVLVKADGLPFEADELKEFGDNVFAFIKAESREPRSFDEVMAWVDTPWISSGKRKDQRAWTPYGKFLARMRREGIKDIDPQPVAVGKVREGGRITSPGPRLDIATAKKLRQPEEGKSTAKDRTEKVPVSVVCPEGTARMASKKESTRKGKGKYGLTVKDAQAALKAADGTPSKGYAATITALCKSLFAGLTVSALKAEEINKLVEVARENGLIG